MKILHAILTDTFYGSERYCAELAALQAASDHEVRILIAAAAPDYRRNFVAPGVDLVALPAWLPAFLHRPYVGRLIDKFKPDIVHTHLEPAARRVGAVAERLRVPHVATLHLDYSHREHGNCDGLICIASWQRGSVPESHAGHIEVVHNWLPTKVAQAIGGTDISAAQRLRDAWTAGETTTVFGSVGRLLPEKGMDVLLKAFLDAFPNGDEDVRLVVVGDGAQRAVLQAQAVAEPRIVLAGWRDDVAPFYGAFDTYVSAARFEPFGLTILEAMAAGCRLVLTRTQGPPEFVMDPRVQWCPVGDPAALAQVMRAEAGQGRNRPAYDMTPFAPAVAVQAIEALYRTVIARRAAVGSVE
jgi:glycosyltransferase involved in cell wall biosynthesis